MKTIIYPARSQWPFILKRPESDIFSLRGLVSEILKDVEKNGDSALVRYTRQYDKVKLKELKITEAEFQRAEGQIPPELKAAILVAKKNITAFHDSQVGKVEIIRSMPGIECWRRSVGIEKVGLYIPGGSAPLFSTILMLGIPASIAGCKEIILCSPPGKTGELNPVILYTARLLGIKKVFKVGGAQAIGAMAYGTETIPRVYKILGPGNQFVTCAKQLVSMDRTAIDIPAGPSELAVLADGSCDPAFVAADLLSQAEHGIDSQVILVSAEREVIDKVNKEIRKQLKGFQREAVARKALLNSKAILVKNNEEGMALLNEYAPEHLIIVCKKNRDLSKKVINAGSVFLGNYSCESAGDYASGTNHTLPTNGFAKSYSGVSVDSFVKKITFQKIGKKGIAGIGKSVEVMAEAEGLFGHKNAIALRSKKIK